MTQYEIQALFIILSINTGLLLSLVIIEIIKTR